MRNTLSPNKAICDEVVQLCQKSNDNQVLIIGSHVEANHTGRYCINNDEDCDKNKRLRKIVRFGDCSFRNDFSSKKKVLNIVHYRSKGNDFDIFFTKEYWSVNC